ncbi:MAG: hypothetical protein IT285_05705 [Bdellovibrionales bacterium]|nr:hypothetical protein [Bdellovibrionales bacterium]
MSDVGKTRNSPDYAAVQAEKDARKRIQRAAEEVTRAQIESQKRLDVLQEEYAQQSERLSLSNEGALQRQQQIGYENMRKIRDEQRRSHMRIEGEGKKREADLEQHYHARTYELETDGDRKLRDVQSRYAIQTDFEAAKGRQAVDHIQEDNRLQVERATVSSQKQQEDLSKQHSERFATMSATYVKASETAEEQFNDKLRNTITKQYKIINDMNQRGADDLKSLRHDTSHKLAAYRDRQGDPFYRLLNMDAEVWDDGKSYVIAARVPEHERENLSISFRGEKGVTLSGSRRNDEKLTLEDGRTRGTSAFQSFFESIPLDYPVDARSLARETDGDWVIFTVKKQGPHARKGPFQADVPARVVAERPDFPGNLPVAEKTPPPEDHDPEDPPLPSPATPGSRPLG